MVTARRESPLSTSCFRLRARYRGGTVSVERFEPNEWGLFQVHGNVFECAIRAKQRRSFRCWRTRHSDHFAGHRERVGEAYRKEIPVFTARYCLRAVVIRSPVNGRYCNARVDSAHLAENLAPQTSVLAISRNCASSPGLSSEGQAFTFNQGVVGSIPTGLTSKSNSLGVQMDT
jgi:hypothetical protein